jgi:hypothetical protein
MIDNVEIEFTIDKKRCIHLMFQIPIIADDKDFIVQDKYYISADTFMKLIEVINGEIEKR